MIIEQLDEKLIRAVKIGYLEGVQRLIVEGGNPKVKEKDGASAWDWANFNNKLNNPNALEIMKALEAVEQRDSLLELGIE